MPNPFALLSIDANEVEEVDETPLPILKLVAPLPSLTFPKDMKLPKCFKKVRFTGVTSFF
jgi:hypothetical protein|tara:strand:- start:7965 stop:8144 length:180 start_codon:yes stop_codon:yes gene_type:complete